MNKNIAVIIVIVVIVGLVFITIKTMGRRVPDTAIIPTGTTTNGISTGTNLGTQNSNATNTTVHTNNTTKNMDTTQTEDSGVQKSEGGVKVTIVKEGTGAVAKVGDTVSMNYTGSLVDGTVFDSNVDPKFHHPEPFNFSLGAGMVIRGWDEGIVGMKVGEKRRLVISPEFGYGTSGQGPIPPNATLNFDVELLSIK